MTLSGPLTSIVILVLGAIVVLLLVGVLSRRAAWAAAIGAIFAIIAGAVGLASSQAPLGLAVAALCGVGLLALLLLPALTAAIPDHVAEAAALLLLGTAGGVALASAADLVWAVVGLETLALSAVTLVALSAGEQSLEAAFKYFVLGAMSLAGLLFGLGFIYLGSGTFGFPSAAQLSDSPLTLAGAVLVAMGFAFELAVFPFHWGALDAYTAASASLAGFVMSASKLAAAFVLGRLVLAAGLPLNQLFVWLGCATILWGTFGALAQRGNLRRMLAYSAITHAGFIGLAIGSGIGGAGVAAFYAAMYGSMAMLVFAGLAARPAAALEADGSPTDGDLRRLGQWRAGALALGLFSLSGIPPTPGFWAKLAVLVVAWQAAGWLPAVIAAFGGVFSVLYYLRPLPDLFAAMRSPAATAAGGPAALPPRRGPLPGVVLAGLAVVALSIFPNIAWTLLR